MDDKVAGIGIGDQVYVQEGADPCGAVRDMARGGSEIIVYVENAGEFAVPAYAVRSVHDGKVVLERSRLAQPVIDAIAHAHDNELPGL
jgi:hypothetical protein